MPDMLSQVSASRILLHYRVATHAAVIVGILSKDWTNAVSADRLRATSAESTVPSRKGDNHSHAVSREVFELKLKHELGLEVKSKPKSKKATPEPQLITAH